MNPISIPMPSPPVVAVVGGGFSGTMVAVNLARQAAGRPLRVLLFERAGRFARGVAYGTSCPEHLLNVPAGLMSALVDKPGHFLDWLQIRDPGAHAGTFAPRMHYGEYLADLLARETDRGTVELVRDEAVDLIAHPQGVIVAGARRGHFRADRVVLALGNPRPQDPIDDLAPLAATGHYVPDPWAQAPLAGLAPTDSVVLVGSSLTAVDLVVEARTAGFRGPITVLSRHGLMPMRHRAFEPRAIAPVDDATPATPRSVLRHLRSEAGRCEREGGDWRSAVDALRPSIPGLWKGFTPDQKRRFVRHLGTRWDVHRHRLAPHVHDTVEAARDAGQLAVVAGRLVRLDPKGAGVEVSLTRRGSSTPETLFAHRVVNCTGPSRCLRPGMSPLVDALIARGLGRPDPLALGLEVTDAGALISPTGAAQGRIFALGPILKGQLWETTAVRELRVQAHDLSRHLLDLSSRRLRRIAS